MHLPVLIRDLAVLMMSAGLVTLIFRALKQPVVLGYIFAGILVGPQISFLPRVLEAENIRLWGEIGVIFVLFSLGLEFSFRKLMRVGGAALFTALIETSLLVSVGTILGLSLNWGWLNSLFLGGMICISSTTIIAKVFEENGYKSRRFAHLVMGILIVEDIVAILLMVLLSTIAVTKSLAGGELAFATIRLAFFIILWFVIGLFLLPVFMDRSKRHMNDETMLIVASGLCFLMVVVASLSGFSPALGAFVMGSLLAETREGVRIEHLLAPIKNFFAAVFFVSVGMLLNFSVVIENWKLVLLLSAMVIIGKSLTVSFGSLVAGQPLKTAVRAGMSMTQIGEFSFIIAGLGLSLKVVNEKLYAIAVAVSVITAFTTPYLLKMADSFYSALNEKMPRRLHQALESYTQIIQTQRGTKGFNLLVQSHFIPAIINGVILIAITGLCRGWMLDTLQGVFVSGKWARVVTMTVNLLLALPFLWGLMLRKRNDPELLGIFSDSPRLRWVQPVFAGTRIAAGVALLAFIIVSYVSWQLLSGISFVLITVLALAFYRFGSVLYSWFEDQLQSRFQAEASAVKEEPPLLPWDSSLVTMVVSPGSSVCGWTLGKFGASETFGVMVAAIERGASRILAPGANEAMYPFDRLSVVGGDEDVERVRKIIEEEAQENPSEPLQLRPLVVEERHPFCGKSLRESGIRSLLSGLVVAVERGGRRWVNPSADWQLLSGDRIWVVGDPGRIQDVVVKESDT